MRFYINPKNQTKEAWLKENMLECSSVPYRFEDMLPEAMIVCLVDNGPFTAAGVCYNEREFNAFNNPRDSRPKMWCVVPRARLLEVCPDLQQYLEKLDAIQSQSR